MNVSAAAAAPDVRRDARRAHAEALRDLSTLAADLENVVGPNVLPHPPEDGGEPLAVDNAIQHYVDALRRGYLAALARWTSEAWRTPPTERLVPFPGSGTSYRYAYDRQHTPTALHARLFRGDEAAGRVKGGVLCSSGMAAIDVLLKTLGYMLADRFRLSAYASYFETHTLLRVSASAHRWRRLFSSDEVLESLAAGGESVLFIEPVQYNWALDATDCKAIVAQIDASAEPPIVVLDTTLSGKSPHLDHFLAMLGRSAAPLVVRVRSGLKLDEEGLELGNLGVIEWWARREEASRFAQLQPVADACRVVSGAGIGWPEACALAPAFVLDPARLHDHSQAIFASNRTLHAQVSLTGELFAAKVYPKPPWDAPFVLFRLREGSREAYMRLAALLARASRRRGMDWIMSGSFGFRTERFETILPAEQIRVEEAPEGVLKIACGRSQGARFWQIVDLLGEFAACDSLAEAEARS